MNYDLSPAQLTLLTYLCPESNIPTSININRSLYKDAKSFIFFDLFDVSDPYPTINYKILLALLKNKAFSPFFCFLFSSSFWRRFLKIRYNPMTVVESGFSKLIQILKFTSLRYLSYADKGTCVRLKFVCQVLPALDGMNLSPYLYMYRYYADKTPV